MFRQILGVVVFLLLLGCKQSSTYQEVSGLTMGTTYMVKANSDKTLDHKAIDSILVQVNTALSTYIPTSDISRFNTSKAGIAIATLTGNHFLHNMESAREVSRVSNNAFDPTVMPLVNYWGFGTTGKKTLTQIDSTQIQAMMAFVGFDKVEITRDSITKSFANTQLDFSAIAKGYGVDEIYRYLQSHRVKDCYVEIGGEVRTMGVNQRGTPWILGINLPDREAALSDFISYVQLTDKAMATSGNYRNYYEIGGKYYGHTIDPQTGYTASSVLSATIIADDCMTADALATACMVLGIENSMRLIDSRNNIEGMFVYSTDDGTRLIKQTQGFLNYQLDE